MKISQKMSLYVFYTMVQKSQKWPKTQIKGGPALIKAGATQTETSLLKQHAAGERVDLLDDYDFPARTITETFNRISHVNLANSASK